MKLQSIFLRASLFKTIIGKAKQALILILLGVESFFGALRKMFKCFNLVIKKLIFFCDLVLI